MGSASCYLDGGHDTTEVDCLKKVPHLARIADELIEAGRPADELVALISRATLPDQRVVETRLDRCAEDLKAAALSPPTLIVVGPVVAMREQLNWLDL